MTLKRSFIAVALFAVAACQKDPPPPAPAPAPAPAAPAEAPKPAAPPAAAPEEPEDESPVAWIIHSGDGNATLKQKPATTAGKCFLTCTVGTAEAWAAPSADCFGEKADRKFLSNDCARTVVMIPAPSRGKAWRQVQVMRVYKKDKLDYPVFGVAALKDEKLMKASRSWLKGCYGNAGDPPHYAADGSAVEYETIDGKKGSVPLAK